MGASCVTHLRAKRHPYSRRRFTRMRPRVHGDHDAQCPGCHDAPQMRSSQVPVTRRGSRTSCCETGTTEATEPERRRTGSSRFQTRFRRYPRSQESRLSGRLPEIPESSGAWDWMVGGFCDRAKHAITQHSSLHKEIFAQSMPEAATPGPAGRRRAVRLRSFAICMRRFRETSGFPRGSFNLKTEVEIGTWSLSHQKRAGLRRFAKACQGGFGQHRSAAEIAGGKSRGVTQMLKRLRKRYGNLFGEFFNPVIRVICGRISMHYPCNFGFQVQCFSGLQMLSGP